MGATWVRRAVTATAINQGWELQAQIPSGSTLRRIHFAWGFNATTDTTIDFAAIAQNLILGGFITVIGTGTEIPPTPVSTPGDPAPPTSRWLWWEARQPVTTSVDWTAGVATWRDSGPQNELDIRAPVLATGIPGGDSLDVWFSWQSLLGAWDASGEAVIWVTSSILDLTP